MSTEIRHDEVEELLGAYALDALDPDEVLQVEAHLENCPRCRAEVDGYRETAAALGTSASVEGSEELPPDLWDRIASGMAGAPQADRSAPPSFLRQVGGSEPEGGPAATVAVPAPVSDLSAARRRRDRRALRWGAAVVGVAAAVAIAVLGVNLSQTNNQLGKTQAALAAQGSGAAVKAALANPQHRLVRLDAPEGTQLAEFVIVPDGRAYMLSSTMPALPDDETYQLWGVIGGQTISLGLLGSHPSQATFTVASSSPPASLAVTVEPAGGVVTPDRRAVATGTVST